MPFGITTAAVVRPDAKSPGIQKSFLEYAQSRGFFVDPARVRRPRDKARVENQIAYVRESCFDGESFSSLDDARRHAESWCRDIAGARVHGTTRLIPREVYEREEKTQMLPAPTAAFDVPTWSSAKVHPDHHVQVGRALYSAPTAYLGQTLEVRVDRATVRLYRGADLVKMHLRVAPGKRSTDPGDYPTGKADYALRSVDRIRSQARLRGASVGDFVAKLLDGPLPWTRMRQAYALVRLCDRYGDARVDALSARALAFEVFDVGRIERMLKAATKIEESGMVMGRVVQLPLGRFARDPATFATRSSGSDEGGAR